VAKKKREHEHPDERWLVSYADMITVLMALFIVLFSISVVNKGKFEELAKSLKDSFSGALVDGGDSVLNFGSSNVTAQTQKSSASAPDQPVPDVSKTQVSAAQAAAQAREREQALERASALEEQQDASLRAAQQQIDANVARLGLQDKVETEINERGLVIRLITDDVVFNVGSSIVRPQAIPLLAGVAGAIDGINNPIRIEGHTDAIPFRGDPLGNVELSTERAMGVYRAMVANGLDRATHPDLAPSGFGETRPLVPNGADGASPRNRRVEVVVLRQRYLEQARKAAEGPLGVNPAGIETPRPPLESR
jgi:chemotaxis protein MotB